METTASETRYPPVSLSQVTGVRPLPFVASENTRPAHPISGFPGAPRARKLTKFDRFFIKFCKVLAFPLLPLRYIYNPKSPPKEPPVDPVAAWRARAQFLETENKRLIKKYEDLRRDYSVVECSADKAFISRWEYDSVLDELLDLSRVVFERYGREEFRAIKEKIEEDKREVAKRCNARIDNDAG